VCCIGSLCITLFYFITALKRSTVCEIDFLLPEIEMRGWTLISCLCRALTLYLVSGGDWGMMIWNHVVMLYLTCRVSQLSVEVLGGVSCWNYFLMNSSVSIRPVPLCSTSGCSSGCQIWFGYWFWFNSTVTTGLQEAARSHCSDCVCRCILNFGH